MSILFKKHYDKKYIMTKKKYIKSKLWQIIIMTSHFYEIKKNNYDNFIIMG